MFSPALKIAARMPIPIQMMNTTPSISPAVLPEPARPVGYGRVHGVGLRLLLSFALLALLPVLAAVVGWSSSDAVREPLARIAGATIKFGRYDRGFRQQARRLNALYADATSFENRARFDESSLEIAGAIAGMRKNIAALAEDPQIAGGAALMDSFGVVEAAITTGLESGERRLDASERARALATSIGETSQKIADILAVAIADVGTLSRSTSEAAALRRSLNVLRIQATTLGVLARDSNTVATNPQQTEPRADFAARLRSALLDLSYLPEGPLRLELAGLFGRIFELGVARDGLFDAVDNESAMRTRELADRQVSRSRIFQLVDELGAIAASNEATANELLTGAGDALRKSEYSLLGAGAACTVLALLVMLVFVRGNVLRRLNALTAATQRLNSGRLETPVPAEGDDELSALAAALEAFRQNALALRRNERVLRERTRALEYVNRELDQFAYVASHDLKAPMRAIDSLAGFLREDLGELLQGDSAEHLDLMQGRIRRLEALLDSLLEYSRVGRERAPREVVNLRETIEASIDLVSPAGVQVRYSGDFGRVSTWKTPLEQIVRNLADNAFKHAGGELPFLTVECDVARDHVKIVIADDGPGIEPEFHERIFGMFQTLQPRDKVEGSGMGLAILKKLIDTYDGRISVDSNPAVQRGTTFTVCWPIDAVLPEVAQPRVSEPVAALARAS